MFKGFSSSICSYPERGDYGKSNYRGNCTGKIIGDFLKTYHKKGLFIDPSIGSGTSVEVAKSLGIPCFGTDLHQGFNLLIDNLAEKAGGQGNSVWWHPPYFFYR